MNAADGDASSPLLPSSSKLPSPSAFSVRTCAAADEAQICYDDDDGDGEERGEGLFAFSASAPSVSSGNASRVHFSRVSKGSIQSVPVNIIFALKRNCSAEAI